MHLNIAIAVIPTKEMIFSIFLSFNYERSTSYFSTVRAASFKCSVIKGH